MTFSLDPERAKHRRANVLLVHANPYCALDSVGEPAGACAVDPHEHDPHNRAWVGAVIDTDRTEVIDTISQDEGDMRCPRQHTKFRFLPGPHRIPNSAYYRERILHGELIPADKATAEKANVPFVDAKLAVENARARAIARHETLYGQGTCPLSTTATTGLPVGG